MLSKNTSFSIGEHFMGLVETQVKDGWYSNASDVMRAALRLLEEREAKLSALRAALIEGEQSGPSTPFDFEAFIARKRGTNPSPYDGHYVLSPQGANRHGRDLELLGGHLGDRPGRLLHRRTLA